MRDLARESRFGKALSRLATACRQELDDLTLEVYTEALCYQVEPDEWEAFTRKAVAAGWFTWLPKVVEILDALREFRGDRPLLVEATEAYERVLQAGVYTPEAGTVWIYRDVRETCGEAAAEAFLAAGGNAAFGSTYRENDRRERFVAAYGEAVRESPAAKLLPAGPTVRALPAPVLPSREEAASVVERLRDMAGVEPPPVKATVVDMDPERVAALKRQLEESETVGAGAPRGEEV